MANSKGGPLASWIMKPEWGPHQRGWSEGARATTQPRPRDELTWILMVSWAELKFQGGSQSLLWQRSGCTGVRVHVHFLCWVWRALNRCLKHWCMCRYVRYTGIFEISLHVANTFSARRACALVPRYAQFVHLRWGTKVEAFNCWTMQGCCWRGTFFSTCFGRGWECIWVYVFVHAHTHTHTARGVPGCEPRGRDETLGGPEEFRRTKSWRIFIRIFVQSTRLNICWAAGWDLGLHVLIVVRILVLKGCMSLHKSNTHTHTRTYFSVGRTQAEKTKVRG